MKKLVSIITVSYNAAKTIEQTIRSVINQTYDSIEYIIIDGGSTDGTVDIIKKYEDQITYWVSEPDKGIYDAMNKGIAHAKGDIIGIINSDDWYELDAVEQVVKHYKEGERVYYGGLKSYQENGTTFVTPATDSLSRLKRGMVVNHPSMFVNREVYERYGAFSLDYRIAADWDFTLKVYMKGVPFVKIDKILANFRLGGVSGALTQKHLKELHLIRKNRNAVGSVDFYYLYDSIRLAILGKYLYKLYILKKKLGNGN